MYPPEEVRVEVGLQFFDRAIIRLAFELRCYDRDHALVDGRVNQILRIHDQVSVVRSEQAVWCGVAEPRLGSVRFSAPVLLPFAVLP